MLLCPDLLDDLQFPTRMRCRSSLSVAATELSMSTSHEAMIIVIAHAIATRLFQRLVNKLCALTEAACTSAGVAACNWRSANGA